MIRIVSTALIMIALDPSAHFRIEVTQNESPQKMMTKRDRQIIHNAVEDYHKQNHIYVTYKIIALICIALNEIFGFGRVRLCRVIDALSQTSLAYDSFEDIKDDILDNRLRRIKMNELADYLKVEGEKLNEFINS